MPRPDVAVRALGPGAVYGVQVRLQRARRVRATDPAVWRQAHGWLLKANAIDADDAGTLMLSFGSFGMVGQLATANAKAALRGANQLVPQDPNLRSAYVRQSLLDGDVEQARIAPRPPAYSTHADADNPAAALLTILNAGPTAGDELKALEGLTAGDGAGAGGG